jgi:hypothetical protein
MERFVSREQVMRRLWGGQCMSASVSFVGRKAALMLRSNIDGLRVPGFLGSLTRIPGNKNLLHFFRVFSQGSLFQVYLRELSADHKAFNYP